MNDELEERLRRTYRAVGEHTAAGAAERSESFRPVVGPPDSSRRWAGAALVAAVVLLLVGGLAVVQRPGSESPAAAPEGAHVLPTQLPMPFGPPGASDGGRPPLVSITSDAETDVIEYASNALSVTISVDRTGLDDLDGGLVEVRGGQAATFEGGGDAGSFRWNTSSGSTVAIEWVGPVFGGADSIIDVVDGLVLVDDETWETATEFGGFTQEQEVVRRTIGPMDVSLRGDIQSGLFPELGLGVSYSGLDTSDCRVYGPGGDGESWAVVSGSSSGTVDVTWTDGYVATAELSPFVPGSIAGVALVERPPSDGEDSPFGECEEAS